MKFYVHKLGCPKNDVDADYITARLMADGHQPVADAEQAESVVVNTCGFILSAKEESIHELLRLGLLKKNGQLRGLYAAGCLSQRHGQELIDGIPELDGVFGLGQLDAIATAIAGEGRNDTPVVTEAARLDYLDWCDRYVDDHLPYAYLKISDGCNRRCSYCAIPDIRGPYRSRSVESVVDEAAMLVERGKKELILVSQDATMYGVNHPGGRPAGIIDLLKRLEAIDGLEWIRLLYLHPAGLSDELIGYMTSGSKTLAYFDIPLQHINDDILSSMGRRVNRDMIETLIGSIREASADATIRTTFIVGLPGETQSRFDELKHFVVDTEFDRMGVFCYSPEEGTPAFDLPGRVPQEIAYERLDEVMTLQQQIAFAKNNALIGHDTDVIIDAVDAGSAVGRTRGDCPDIDQEVFVSGGNPGVGDIRRVTITASKGYDLEGVITED